MHVAMVTPLPPDCDRPRGGVEAVAICLIRALVKAGVRVTVIQWGSPEAGPHLHPALNCTVFPLPIRHPVPIANWLVTSGELKRIVARLQPDVVHVHDQPELGARLEGPHVLTVHGNNPRDEWLLGGPRRYAATPIVAFTFWWCMRKYDHVILSSPYSRRFGHFGRRAKLFDVDNPVDDGFFRLQRGEFKPVVLVVGLLSELKNTMAVVSAAARIRQDMPEVQFHVVGRWRDNAPAYRRQVESFWEAENLRDTVHFLGSVSRHELAAEYETASCLLLPSFQESAPMVIAQAMAAGVPVAASAVGGIPWMVKEGQTGFLFDPRNLDQIAACLTRLLKDRAMCETMGRAAREEARVRFRADAVARKTLAVYQAAIDDGSR